MNPCFSSWRVSMNLRLPGLAACLVLLVPLLAFAASSTPDDEKSLLQENQAIFNIGIVTDGDTAKDHEITALFQREIQALAEEEFLVNFPETMTLSGKDTVTGVNLALDQLFANPKTDLVLTLGAIGSSEVLRRKHLPKPVVAPYVMDSFIQQLPRKDGTSGLTNLTYIDSMFYLDRELVTLQKIVPFKNLAILVDQRDFTAIPELSKFARKLANEHTITVNTVLVDSSAANGLAAIPTGTDAVMVGPLYHLSDDENKLLIQGLIDRGLPGYSLWSREQVDNGLLVGDVPVDMEENLVRRAAVSVQDILLGDEAASLDVTFSRGHELTINMATARALDIYPSLAILTGASLLNEQREDISRRLTLQQAITEALQGNLELSSAEFRVKAGSHAVTEARSPLLPQIQIGTGARAIDTDRAELSMGSSPERAWTGTASGSQQIYSEQSWAGYTVEQHKQTGRIMEHETVRLDIIYEASTAYFNVLRARTIEQLYKDNLKLTQANLKRSRIRLSTGVAGPDEVYRWETKYATNKIDVLEKESISLDAMVALNRILDRPLQELFIAEETDLSDPLLIVGDQFFFTLMQNPKYFHEFRSFAIEEALAYRTELKSIDAAIAAKKRIETASARAYWLPDFSIEGQVEEYFAEDGTGQRGDFQDGLDDTDWQIGVFARLPLFEGGRKSGALNRNREELAQLKTDRRAAANRISQDMLTVLNRTRASYPGISLSREAADSAGRNLTLITDSYVQGIKSIIELLDAQNQALTTDQAAANAVYNFLIDLMGVQRAMGEFTLFQPEEERKAWMQRAKQYMQ
jgi:outer membrane protein